MQVDPTSVGAERERASRAIEDELDEVVATACAEDAVPEAVVQAAHDAAGVSADPGLDDTIAAVCAEDAVPDAVAEAAREVYRTAVRTPASPSTEPEPARHTQ
jgi:hypothetical protein